MRIIGAGILLLLWAGAASAMILSGRGNDPVRDNNWPAGAIDVANLKTRIGWWEGPPFGGGEHHFCYRGDAAALQDALDKFAAIKAPRLELIVQPGPMADQFMTSESDPKDDGRIDFAFVIWNPQSWYHLYNDPKSTWNGDDPHFRQPLPPPRLEVYVGGDGGQIDFSKVKVPASVTVIDERADANGATGTIVRADVYDMLTSKPIAGAELSIATQEKAVAQGQTDSSGHVEVKDIPPGSYRIAVSAKGYAPRLLGYETLRGNMLKRFDSIRLAPTVSLSGTSSDADGKALAGVTVIVHPTIGFDGMPYPMPEERQTKSDEKGHFELAGLPQGFCQLRVRKETYQQLEALTLYSIPSEGVTLKLVGTGSVKGRVIDGDGKPSGMGNVSLYPPGDRIGKWSGSMQLKPDGTFAFENVPPGHYFISTDSRASFQQKGIAAKELDVVTGKVTEIDVPATRSVCATPAIAPSHPVPALVVALERPEQGARWVTRVQPRV